MSQKIEITKKTREHLSKLDPNFRALIEQAIVAAHAAGLNVQISDSLRTAAEQDALYAHGRTEKGSIKTNARRWQSLHNYGLAVDLFFIVDGKGRWDDVFFDQFWLVCLKEKLDAKGLVWSGLWTGSLREKAHFQLGKPDWRELARAKGIDPITLNPFQKNGGGK